MKTLAKQDGFSLGGFVQLLAVIVVLAVLAMKLVPAYMEAGTIQKTFDEIVKDPAMQGASVSDVKGAFRKRAVTMNNVAVITADDIVIANDGKSLSLSASYSKTIPLAGNVSLLLEFNPASPR